MRQLGGIRARVRAHGPVTVEGSIEGVRSGRAMQELVKRPDSILIADVTWAAVTTDGAGQLIPWVYNLSMHVFGPDGEDLFGPTQLFPGGWKLVQPGGKASRLQRKLPLTLPSGDYQAIIFLLAMESTGDGHPAGLTDADPWFGLDSRALPFRVQRRTDPLPSTGPATVGGDLGAIELSQHRGLR